MPQPNYIPYQPRHTPDLPPADAAAHFYQIMKLRRSVRHFSDKPVSRKTIEALIQTAGSAPSGANKQPWRFVCVSDPKIKHEIRLAAEQEERAFYQHRAGEDWLKDLQPLGTDPDKSFLDTAPWLVVVFKLAKDDHGHQVYYVNESVGLACGFFLVAAHHAGLATLTHTPSPMKFLTKILGRPDHERPFLLIPVGYPTDNCVVPEHATHRKPLSQIMVTHE